VKTYDAFVCGICCVDTVVKPIQQFPATGSIEYVKNIELHTGGSALNTGLSLIKLGAKVAIAGKIGNDNLGMFIREKLKTLKIEIKYLREEAGVNTSASLVLINTTGERGFLHNYGANATFTPKDFNWQSISKTKYMHMAGAFLMPGFDGDPMAAVLRRARSQKIKTSVDTGYDITGRWLHIIEPCLQYIDIFMPSYDEARSITGRDEPEAIAQFLLDRKVSMVVLKMGEKGCYIKTKERSIRLPAIPVKDVVDTTGAGDAFVAGFLYGIIKGWSVERCGLFANAVGANCVQAIGATAGVRTFSQTQQFMMKAGLNTGKA
jgi:sugar/nucleoside kinase (ribokinase family)